jgi:hypothetical protein
MHEVDLLQATKIAIKHENLKSDLGISKSERKIP